MRHSTAHLVVAFCSSMAVSAAPLSPLPPGSPALISPSLTPRSAKTEDFEKKDHEAPVQKRSVGGFAYHTGDSMISKRTDVSDKGVMKTQNRPSRAYSDIDSDSYSSSSSGSDMEGRSMHALAIRSAPSPQKQNEDMNKEQAGVNSFEAPSSIQEEDDSGWNSDESYAAGSEDLDADIEDASIVSYDESFNPDDTSSANIGDKTFDNDKTTVDKTANSAQKIDEVKPETAKRSVDFIA
ncbi:hypothetical protein Golomagni_03892 [Golovinomyces magnicellulatus]|nr:hypothetical protein Golomagni_03892 [Golovinomyces magnicellulatus]